jgi:two-component system phosphate regulon response regulator PhoB
MMSRSTSDTSKPRHGSASSANSPSNPGNPGSSSGGPQSIGSPPTNATARTTKRILVVDDERDLTDLLAFNLQRAGYDVIPAYNGSDAIDIARRDIPDLIILDLMLPGMDGTEVTRRLKADTKTAGIPIIMLSAKSEETDVVVGLTLGADDYVTKPFSPKILLARMATVLRRSEQPHTESGILRAGPLSIDTSKHDVTLNDESVRLTLTEFKLLHALVSARGRVLTRDQLMDKAMGTDVFVTDRAIDVHITAIRKKLGDSSWLVHTVRGVGYRLRESNDDDE